MELKEAVEFLMNQQVLEWNRWRKSNPGVLRPDLSGIDFSRINLAGANLSFSNLKYANFQGADLSYADLRGVDLTRVDFRGAHIQGADISGATIVASPGFENWAGSTFWRKDDPPSFVGAQIPKAQAEQTPEASELKRLVLRSIKDWNQWRLGRKEQGWLEMRGAEFSGMELVRINFAKVDLSNSDLSFTTLSNASFQEARLLSANLEGSKLHAADLRHSALAGAILKDASLWLADLKGANFVGTDISGADLSKAKGLTQKQLEQAVWAPGHPPSLPEGIDLPVGKDNEVKTNEPAASATPSIRLVGAASSHHFTLSSIGIGGGLVGVSAVFLPYEINDDSFEALMNLLHWEGAEDLGGGSESLERVLSCIGSDLITLGVDEEGLLAFLLQLKNEPWIIYSASPLNNGPLPGEPRRIAQHSLHRRLFAALSSRGIILIFTGALFSGVFEDIGKGIFQEISGIEDVTAETRNIVREVLKVIARLTDNDVPERSAAIETPRAVIRPDAESDC